MQTKRLLLTGFMVVILLSGCGRAGKNTANNSETISTAADTYNEQKTEIQTDKTQTKIVRHEFDQ